MHFEDYGANTVKKHHPARIFFFAATLCGLLVRHDCFAQDADGKAVAIESPGVSVQVNISPFAPFNQWSGYVSPPPSFPPVVASTLVREPMQAPAPAGVPYEAMPVIMGQPDLPLMGQAAAQAAQQWNSGLNYQGLAMSYIVFDAAGIRREVRPVSRGLAVGERFRIRYTTTYEAVAALTHVVGDGPWTAQRAGQAWPQQGQSVLGHAGETVELPLNPDAYFRLDSLNERYVLTVRHPRSGDAARSNQPAYRQDGATGSQYLQLVPAGMYPAIEQLISARAR